MPTTRKQKRARKSRGLDILSGIENFDIMLGENHFNETERDESLNSTSVRRHESVMSNILENEGESSYSNHRNSNVRANADYGQDSADVSSQVKINKLSSELNSRISREMDEMMNSVSVQIQRAINDAISNQVLPQIQNVILAGSGRATRKGWDVLAERPEVNPEVQRNLNALNNLRNEQDEGHQNGDFLSYNVHDTCCCKISKKLKGDLLETLKISKKSPTKPKKGRESLIVPKKWKRGPFCFGMVLYFMLEAFGCVQNQVLSTFGKSALCTKRGT